ncbi:MAG TPA: hypothetical protein VKU60_15230 [Chloroflexota bacterium]|nr:hypothetical protein [Chloroflexota bacterium]
MVAPKNLGVEIYGTTPAILYNTNNVPASAAPQKLADVLDPKW